MRFIFFLFSIFLISTNSKAIQFESLESKNGIKFWLIEDKTLPLVSMSFSFKGGSILDAVGQDGATNLMISLSTLCNLTLEVDLETTDTPIFPNLKKG